MMGFDPNSIVAAVEEQLAQHLPDAVAREMYGGTMMELVPGDHATRLCGYFVHKAHVSVEFSFGATLDDPDAVFEGRGKFRRHLKLKSNEDIEAKGLRFFLQQLAR